MNLYIVRHGETEWNREKRFQGQNDSKLTDIGILQAESLGKYLKGKNINFDRVYASPLERAYKTAGLISDNMPIIKDERLMEMHFGTWEGKNIEHIKKVDNENFHNFFNATEKYTHKPHAGESFDDLEKRVREFLEDIKREHQNENILVVSHGVTLKIFLKIIREEKLEEFAKTGVLANTSISLITYNNRWNIEFLSKTEHLEDDLVTEWVK